MNLIIFLLLFGLLGVFIIGWWDAYRTRKLKLPKSVLEIDNLCEDTLKKIYCINNSAKIELPKKPWQSS